MMQTAYIWTYDEKYTKLRLCWQMQWNFLNIIFITRPGSYLKVTSFRVLFCQVKLQWIITSGLSSYPQTSHSYVKISTILWSNNCNWYLDFLFFMKAKHFPSSLFNNALFCNRKFSIFRKHCTKIFKSVYDRSSEG